MGCQNTSSQCQAPARQLLPQGRKEIKRKSLSKGGLLPRIRACGQDAFPKRATVPAWLPVRGHGVPMLMSLWLGVSRAVVVGTPGEKRVPKAGQSKALAAEREINYGHFAALQVTAKADVSPVGR